MPFSITYAAHDGDAARVRLSGELDLSTAEKLTAVLDELAAAGARRLLIDLTDLTFCDSTGIAAFVRGDNRAAARGGWLRVTGATGRVHRLLEVTGLGDVLRHEPDGADPT